MTNRIINFYVGNDEMDEESIFHMGYQLTKRFSPYKMIFANEKDKYQWSVYMIQKGEEWKLDISVLPENIVKGKVEKQELLKSLFTEKKRECILFFKQQSGYNRYYTSDHVYKAVLEDDIHDDMSFLCGCKDKKSKSTNVKKSRLGSFYAFTDVFTGKAAFSIQICFSMLPIVPMNKSAVT
ncbi:hypothetical protein G3M54_28360 [Bacillus megaterium NBRC 15308 = ATCC 14581]|nr:hypothetical protein [Priestia megaterium NBRC 15308 = ATCC 14581]